MHGIYLSIILIASTILLVLSLDQMIGYVPNGALMVFTIALTTIYYSIIQIMKRIK